MKSAGKNSGMEIVWCVALLGQVVPVQAAGEKSLLSLSRCGCEVNKSLAG